MQTLSGIFGLFTVGTRGKYKNITSLKSKAGVPVTSMQGKLEVFDWCEELVPRQWWAGLNYLRKG